MKPGPELDILIAEKVMGWKISPNRSAGCPPGYNALAAIPPYSTDIAEAWPLVEKFEMSIHAPFDNNGWVATVMKESSYKYVPWEAESLTAAPHAICLAALKAIGIDVR